jgi:hypothetical protein
MKITKEIIGERIDYYEKALAQTLKSVDQITGALKELEGMREYLAKEEPLLHKAEEFKLQNNTVSEESLKKGVIS